MALLCCVGVLASPNSHSGRAHHLDAFFRQPVVETDRLSLYALMEREARRSAWKIVDVGGGTAGHLTFADTVVDIGRGTAEWYRKHWPAVRYIEHNVAKRLPLQDNEFTIAFSSHCIEHVPDPELFCDELSRVAQYVALCYPRPIQDSLVSGSQASAGAAGHKWWLSLNSTPPAHVGFMPRQELLSKMPNFERRGYIEHGLMNTFHRAGWEQCVVGRAPLRCAATAPSWTPLFLHVPRNATSSPWPGWMTSEQVGPGAAASLRGSWSLGQLKKLPAQLRNRNGQSGGGGLWQLSALLPLLDWGSWLAASLFLGLAYYQLVTVIGMDVNVFRGVTVGLVAGVAIGGIGVFSRTGYF